MRKILAALAQAIPETARLSSVEVGRRHGQLVVGLVSPDPASLIGEQGRTADAIRRALVDAVGDETLGLNIRQAIIDVPDDDAS